MKEEIVWTGSAATIEEARALASKATGTPVEKIMDAMLARLRNRPTVHFWVGTGTDGSWWKSDCGLRASTPVLEREVTLQDPGCKACFRPREVSSTEDAEDVCPEGPEHQTMRTIEGGLWCHTCQCMVSPCR